jgi:hypothetical protein
MAVDSDPAPLKPQWRRCTLCTTSWRLYVTETTEGVMLTPHDPTFEKGMDIAKRAMKTYRNALKELAK